ncbi:MAG: ROK family protein [Verrucomicrobiales bacterium]|nr:ROK family protein [Verrucomicrobiales bacterium]
MILGIEIGGTKLQLVLGEASGRIRQRRRLPVDVARGAEGIRAAIERELPQLLRGRRISAVGVGFGGPVDWRTGRVARSHQIEGWSEFDLRGWLQPLTGAPVAVDNDANVAALAEAHCGAGVGLEPVFYVTLGSGVGGGLVLGGQIYHGATPGEAEIGHVRLDRRGTILESRCSGWAVDARIRRWAQEHPRSVLAQLARRQPGHEARHLVSALRQGDPGAKRLLADTAATLAFGLSHVVHLFHPAVIVLGGGLARVGEPLRRAVADALPRWVMRVFHPVPPIRLSRLGEDVVPVGALLLAGTAGGR